MERLCRPWLLLPLITVILIAHVLIWRLLLGPGFGMTINEEKLRAAYGPGFNEVVYEDDSGDRVEVVPVVIETTEDPESETAFGNLREHPRGMFRHKFAHKKKRKRIYVKKGKSGPPVVIYASKSPELSTTSPKTRGKTPIFVTKPHHHRHEITTTFSTVATPTTPVSVFFTTPASTPTPKIYTPVQEKKQPPVIPYDSRKTDQLEQQRRQEEEEIRSMDKEKQRQEEERKRLEEKAWREAEERERLEAENRLREDGRRKLEEAEQVAKRQREEEARRMTIELERQKQLSGPQNHLPTQQKLNSDEERRAKAIYEAQQNALRQWKEHHSRLRIQHVTTTTTTTTTTVVPHHHRHHHGHHQQQQKTREQEEYQRRLDEANRLRAEHEKRLQQWHRQNELRKQQASHQNGFMLPDDSQEENSQPWEKQSRPSDSSGKDKDEREHSYQQSVPQSNRNNNQQSITQKPLPPVYPPYYNNEIANNVLPESTVVDPWAHVRQLQEQRLEDNEVAPVVPDDPFSITHHVVDDASVWRPPVAPTHQIEPYTVRHEGQHHHRSQYQHHQHYYPSTTTVRPEEPSNELRPLRPEATSEREQAPVIVTALIDIGRGSWHRFTRPFDLYLDYLLDLLKLKNNFIIYCDKSVVEFLESQGDVIDPSRLQIVETSLQELPYYRYRSEMQTIMDEEQANWKPKWEAAIKHHPEALSADYNVLVNSKAALLRNATHISQFPGTHFIWLDAGYSHGDKALVPEILWKPTLMPNKITIVKITGEQDIVTNYSIDHVYRKQWTVLSGGIIAGDVDTIERFWRFFHKTFVDLLDSRKTDDDQTTLLMTVVHFSSLFNVLNGGWFDAFRLLPSQ